MALSSVQAWLVYNRVTWKLVCATALVSLTVFNFGFDQTAYSTIQAMDPFIKRFGQCNDNGKCSFSSLHLSFLNSLPRITFAIGIVLGGLVGERFGRRPVVLVYCVISLLSSIVSYTAKSYGQLLAGRMLLYMYIGMEGWLVPMFQAEIVPAHMRGAVTVSYVFNHIFGSFIMACVTYRTSNWTSDMCWKLPIALGFILPSISILLIWVMPESPRWLIRRGRDEEALKMLRHMFGSAPDYAPEAEFELLKASLEDERKRESGSWMSLFRGSNRRRTMIAIMTQFLNQGTGQVFVSQYGTIFIKSLGTINAFTFTLINQGIQCIGPLITIFTIDRLGRRRMYLGWGSLSCICIFIVGGLGFAKATHEVKAGIVAMTILYMLFYIMSFGPIGAITTAECSSLQLRDKTSNIGWNVQNLTNFVVAFTLPYLMNSGAGNADLGSKVGFIYGAVALLGLIWAYFCFPELKDRSLEEVDEMFEARVSARRSRKWVSTNPDSIGARITRMENEHGEAITGRIKLSDDAPDKPAVRFGQTANRD